MNVDTIFDADAALAKALLSALPDQTTDGSHDLAHILRVWANVQRLIAGEGGNAKVLLAATLLHDCVAVEKNAPERARASLMAAEYARDVLAGLAWAETEIAEVCHAIEAHSFSAGVPPETLEAMILQDADRLDALGHIGIARCFYVSGRLERGLYDPDDPSAQHRPLDDMAFALDHFQTKLLKLSEGFQTNTGARLANERHGVVQRFFDGMLAEAALA